MKTEKEYPATHSMMTSWFAIDEEGNVAIMNYEDNGPVPEGTPETAADEVVMNYMSHKVDGKPYRLLQLSGQEIQHLLDVATEYPETLDDGERFVYAVVRIAHSGMDEFLEAAQLFTEKSCDYTVCLNEKERIFYLDWYAAEEPQKTAMKRLHSSGTVKVLRMIDWDGDYDSDNPLKELPFFVYVQPYSCGKPLERRKRPGTAFKADRLTQETRRMAHRLALRFNDERTIQIAEHLPSHSYGISDNYIDNRRYGMIDCCHGKKKLVAEESIYYAGCGKQCRKCYHGTDNDHWSNFHVQKTKTPTVLVIADATYVEYDVRTSFELPYSNSVFLSIVEGVPYDIHGQDSKSLREAHIRKCFPYCRTNLEKNIGFFRPRVILIYRDVLKHIKEFYELCNGTLHIAGEQYPVFIWEEREKDMDKINGLAMMEYRGGDFKWIIPVEHIDLFDDF